MNFLPIFSTMLVLYSMGATASESQPPCKPRLIKALINQNNRTLETIQNNLDSFQTTQGNIDHKIKNIDISLLNIQETTSEIGQKVDNQDELLRSFNETLADSDPNCDQVDNKLSTKAESTLEITDANNKILVTVEQQQNDLAEQLKNIKTSTEASLKALSALITDKVITKLQSLEQSLKNVEANQDEIKSELNILCRLNSLSNNILEHTKLIEGQLTSLNDTQESRLVVVKDDIEQTIIENSICSKGHPFKHLSAEVKIIESKLGSCQNTENLLNDGIEQIHKNDAVVKTQVTELKTLTDEKTKEVLHNQKNCGRYGSYSTYDRYPFNPRPY